MPAKRTLALTQHLVLRKARFRSKSRHRTESIFLCCACTAWCADANEDEMYMQVNFDSLQIISGLIVAGLDSNNYASDISIMYSASNPDVFVPYTVRLLFYFLLLLWRVLPVPLVTFTKKHTYK